MNPRKYTFDNEDNIFEVLRSGEKKFLPFTDKDKESESFEKITSIFFSLYTEHEWGKWINNSNNTNYPPDYYSEELKMMMEVMRVDDNATKNGRLNKRLSSENKILNEIGKNGVIEHLPNLKTIMINANSQIQTNEDHSYSKYLNNFARVVNKHTNNNETYRKNYEDYGLIFFVFDETSGIYFESHDSGFDMKPGLKVSGRPNLHMYNLDFLKIIKNSGADYFVWFKPFSFIPESMPFELFFLPGITIYDVKHMDESIKKYKIEYNHTKMKSIEV